MNNNKSEIKDKNENIDIAGCIDKVYVGIIWEYWFRQLMDDKYKSISIVDITNIIIAYYDYIRIYHGKFIQNNCAKGIEIINDHEIKIVSSSYSSAKLDEPIYERGKWKTSQLLSVR